MNEQSEYFKGFERRLTMLEFAYKQLNHKINTILILNNIIFIIVTLILIKVY
jgi:hypothetical protein